MVEYKGFLIWPLVPSRKEKEPKRTFVAYTVEKLSGVSFVGESVAECKAKVDEWLSSQNLS